MVGSAVTIRGIVTGVKSDGFFVQEEDVEPTRTRPRPRASSSSPSSPPPAAAAFTAQVQVTGTVAEFVPGSDPQQPPSTQLAAPTIRPAHGARTAACRRRWRSPATFPDPAGAFDQLERVEHMRVSAASITVIGPSDGSVDESTATGTSNGRFHGVVTGVARPFREAGIQAPDSPPSGAIPPIPRWDSNPERLRIDSAAINASRCSPSSPATSSAPSPVRSTTRRAPTRSIRTARWARRRHAGHAADDGHRSGGERVHGRLVQPAALLRHRRRSGDGDAVLTATAYDKRLAKASIAIRKHLLSPDIIAVQEVENVVEAVTQIAAGELLVNPDNSTVPLCDRPPLVLEATVTGVGELPSWSSARMCSAWKASGTPCRGAMAGRRQAHESVRSVKAQAESLANYVQGRQMATPPNISSSPAASRRST